MTEEMPGAVLATLRSDPRMADLVDRHGSVTVEPAEHEFQRLVVSIVTQSISTAAARSLRADLFDAFDGVITPAAVLGRDVEMIAEIVGGQKAEYIRNVARAYADGEVSAAAFADRGDEAVVDRLTEIRGVGRWTAEMYLMFVLGREDVFPIGDLAVRRGVKNVYGELSREEMIEKSADWQPYRSYATKYIWAEYES
jgi:DNA-3-methyladenine glycosylase II